MIKLTFELPDLAAVTKLAARIAQDIRPKDCLAFRGDLGSGKTSFARALLRAFGVAEDVPSPTFTLQQTYETTRFPVSHFDFYRLRREEEAEELGLSETFSSDVCIIEWPERIESWLPRRRWEMHFLCKKDRHTVTIMPPADVSFFILSDEVKRYLTEIGWVTYTIEIVAADFSSRRFFRLRREGREPASAILMLADVNDKTESFITVGAILRHCGLHAPITYAHKVDADGSSMVLLQDLGYKTVGAALDTKMLSTDVVKGLYRDATDVLVRLHARFIDDGLSDLPSLDTNYYIEQIRPFLTGYIEKFSDAEAVDRFKKIWLDLLTPLESLPQSIILRDFMFDNIIERAGREKGADRLALIDYQDAGIGSIAYDLASLAEQVRRDLPIPPGEILTDIVRTYHQSRPVVPLPVLLDATYILSAQRHMRTAGRLRSLNKAQYLPRVETWIRYLLQKPCLRELNEWCARYAPHLARGAL